MGIKDYEVMEKITNDLVVLVKRLAHSLRKAAPDNELSAQALDYLARHELEGSSLRKITDAIDNARRDGCADVIATLEKAKDNFNARYLSKERVSMAQIAERDDFIDRCDWAIKLLRSYSDAITRR